MGTDERPRGEHLPPGTGAGPVLSAGKATRGQIFLAVVAMLVMGGLLLYALNQPVREPGRTTAAGMPATTELAPGDAGRATSGGSSR